MIDRCQTTAPPTAESVDRVNSKDVRGEITTLVTRDAYSRSINVSEIIRGNGNQ